ncbi:1-acyl-sn-glycerol-3-phosphate acyltransferase [Pseudobutyrivibrio sp. YE44]|uniref:lysophospholipid acyltransferase family protein n=1 Tax=Pseudobutyrivibrio sp. YE44 TaxID=1520802 RepID=UPI000881178C|nr:lysophospholipid acyltransferase family protein [Pseudobutyrivibrio sp. YE44]SDB51420.1 1-acyl-sn-glycerol-3-phosphate acyltransferase [Pseudobutyrivibrio sp. YE44]
MIRTLLALIFVVIFLIVSIPIWGLLFILGLFNKKAKDRIGYKCVAWAFGVVAFLGGARYQVKGLENIPKDTPVLYIGNHQSFFDVILGYHLCPPVTGFLSKQTFEKVPLLNVWMKMNYCLFLTRTNPRQDLKLIIQAQEFIKQGVSMFVFPEGTRSKTGEMAPFHEASLKIATKTGCPIIPVAFTNTREVFETHLPRMKKTKVIITFCPPVDPNALEGEDKKHPGVYVQKNIQAQLDEDAKLL